MISNNPDSVLNNERIENNNSNEGDDIELEETAKDIIEGREGGDEEQLKKAQLELGQIAIEEHDKLLKERSDLLSKIVKGKNTHEEFLNLEEVEKKINYLKNNKDFGEIIENKSKLENGANKNEIEINNIKEKLGSLFLNKYESLIIKETELANKENELTERIETHSSPVASDGTYMELLQERDVARKKLGILKKVLAVSDNNVLALFDCERKEKELIKRYEEEPANRRKWMERDAGLVEAGEASWIVGGNTEQGTPIRGQMLKIENLEEFLEKEKKKEEKEVNERKIKRLKKIGNPGLVLMLAVGVLKFFDFIGPIIRSALEKFSGKTFPDTKKEKPPSTKKDKK